MFDFSNNYKIARRAASEGIVLLKNEDKILPLKPNDTLSFIGENCLSIHKGGGGSSDVIALYEKTLLDGLIEKQNEGKVALYSASVELAKGKNTYSVDELNELAKHSQKAVVCIQRVGVEGGDRYVDRFAAEKRKDSLLLTNGDIPFGPNFFNVAEKVGYFIPSDEEIKLFETIEKSNIKEVIVILNIDAIIDLSYLNNYPKVKAIVLAYLPGMEGGTAIADILCGDVNPSGKLTDTIALSYNDYPSSENGFIYNTFSDYKGKLTFDGCNEYDNPSSPYFEYDRVFTKYQEDIFVGYRYFETFAKDRVLYPFGFGLSYTEFSLSDYSLSIENGRINIGVTIKNIGDTAGKEVIEVYSSSPKGVLDKPAIELRAFKKTKLLQPNEAQTLLLSFPISDMASFDEKGLTGNEMSWVLENGEYRLFVGTSVRCITEIGTHYISENTVTKAANKSKENIFRQNEYTNAEIDKNISLYDVFEGKNTIYEFVRQLSAAELIHLASGQYPDFAQGTSGMGNIGKLGIPNPQTADGPAGLRKSVPTTSFPCPTLFATSWDEELQYEIGKAMGFEGVSTGVDILLGPGLNIHRTHLCGRNFEYYSEDPYISGKTAAAIVNGIQSEGLCACIKHFAANNIEFYRMNNDSIVGERALREIYLKGFEIAVKEANPAFIMTSYNLLNGFKTSTNKYILTDILRNEWEYDGCVMTDWSTWSHIWQEIKAGNNIHMPFGYLDEEELALEKYNSGRLTRYELENNAIYVLKAVMKTKRFKDKNFGIVHTLSNRNVTEIDITKTLGVSSSRIVFGIDENDGRGYFSGLTFASVGYPTYLLYQIEAENEGIYNFACDIKTDFPQSKLWLSVDNGQAVEISCTCAINENTWYTVGTDIKLINAKHILKITLTNAKGEAFDDGSYKNMTEKHFSISNIKISPVK